jgi:hypothetical protein
MVGNKAVIDCGIVHPDSTFIGQRHPFDEDPTLIHELKLLSQVLEKSCTLSIYKYKMF